MKTQIANIKDNVATAALVGALLIALIGGVINSTGAAAATRHEVKTVSVTQHMDTIVVTARR